MSLVKSISGIRGTIGGRVGEGLNPVDIVRFTAAYATRRRAAMPDNNVIVVGRDARLSGHMVESIVCGTLMGMGYDVVNIGLASTPTTELAVTGEHEVSSSLPAIIPNSGMHSNCLTSTASSSMMPKEKVYCLSRKPKISLSPKWISSVI